MIELLHQGEWMLLGYLANALWQVPVVVAAAWLAARFVRRAGVAGEHRVWVTALLLEALLPAVQLDLRTVWNWLKLLVAGRPGTHGGDVRVLIGTGVVHADRMRMPSSLLAGIAIGSAGIMVYFAARLVWGVWRTEQMRRRAAPAMLDREASEAWRRLGGAGVEIRISEMVSGPVTVGVFKPAVLVPAGFPEGVSREDFRAATAHELAHVRRWDFTKNLFYEAMSVGVAWHPVAWFTRAQVAESREILCDAMAADAGAGRERYARSLLRLAATVAGKTQAKTLQAIGIFDANSLERRVMNLTKSDAEVRFVQRMLMIAAGAAMVAGVSAIAMALRLEVGPELVAVEAAGGAGPVKIAASKAQAKYKKPPVYPAEAKKNKDTLDGPVVLAVIIGKDGAVEQIRVKKSLREDYDRSALDAVKDWKWEPFLLNGEPVEVDTTVTVNYSLTPEDKGDPKAQADDSPVWDVAPKIIRQVDAEYPAKARISKDTLNGAVIVGLAVGADGVPREVRIVSSLRSDYDESALDAVRQYRFSPAMAGGRPIDAGIQVQVDFRLY